MDKIMNYNFFIQAQIDHNTDTVLGYEFLLRKKGPNGWYLPSNFEELSLEEQFYLAEQTLTRICYPPKERMSLSFNLTSNQAQDNLTIEKIIAFQKKIAPVSLTIEFTEYIPLKRLTTSYHL